MSYDTWLTTHPMEDEWAEEYYFEGRVDMMSREFERCYRFVDPVGVFKDVNIQNYFDGDDATYALFHRARIREAEVYAYCYMHMYEPDSERSEEAKNYLWDHIFNND